MQLLKRGKIHLPSVRRLWGAVVYVGYAII
jgi:hypothetical protein